MIGQEKTKVSLVSATGSFIDDLTKYIVSGTCNRKRNTTTTFNGIFSSDISSWSTLRKVNTWSTFIRVERDGRDQWEGPVTTAEDGEQFSLVDSDLSAYWSRRETKSSTHTNSDVATIASALLTQGFKKREPGLPIINSSIVGKLTSKTYSDADSTMIMDNIKGLPGLEWYLFGRTVYLFGTPDYPKSSFKLTDESWNPLPTVEKSGTTYANRVVVKGNRVTGIAEAPVAEINYDGGVLCRRFDRPELETQSAVDAEAEKRLAQCRDALYINAQSFSILKPDVNIDLANVLPGSYVDVDHYVGAIPVNRQMRINEVRLDCVTSEVSIALEPLGVTEGVNQICLQVVKQLTTINVQLNSKDL